MVFVPLQESKAVHFLVLLQGKMVRCRGSFARWSPAGAGSGGLQRLRERNGGGGLGKKGRCTRTPKGAIFFGGWF